MDRRIAILWLIGSTGTFLYGLAGLIWPGVVTSDEVEPSPVGSFLWMAIAAAFFAVGLVNLVPRPREQDQTMVALLIRRIEYRLPAVMIGLALVAFGLMFLFALASGSLFASFILLFVVLALLNILDEYHQNYMIAPLLQENSTGEKSSRKNRKPAAVLKRLKKKLSALDALRSQKFEIVRIHPIGNPEDAAKKKKPSMMVTVEISDGRQYAQLAACMVAYYLPSALVWSLWHRFHEQAFQPLESAILALGFSLLVLPATLVALAAKLSMAKTMTVAFVAIVIHHSLLGSSGVGAENRFAAMIQNDLPAAAGAWLVGVACLIAAERVTAQWLGIRETFQIDAQL